MMRIGKEEGMRGFLGRIRGERGAVRLTTAFVLAAAMSVSLLGAGSSGAAPTIGLCGGDGANLESPVVCADELTAGLDNTYSLVGVTTGDTIVIALKPVAPGTFTKILLTDAQGNDRSGDCVDQNAVDACNTSSMGNGAWTVVVENHGVGLAGHYILSIVVISTNVGDPTQSCEGGADAPNSDAGAITFPAGAGVGTALNPIATTFVCKGRLGPSGGVADNADWYKVNVGTSTAVGVLGLMPQSGLDTRATVKEPNGNVHSAEFGGAGQPDLTPVSSLASSGDWKFGALVDGVAPAEQREYTVVVHILAP